MCIRRDPKGVLGAAFDFGIGGRRPDVVFKEMNRGGAKRRGGIRTSAEILEESSACGVDKRCGKMRVKLPFEIE
jgi:hypothetical protein